MKFHKPFSCPLNMQGFPGGRVGSHGETRLPFQGFIFKLHHFAAR